MGCPFRVSLPTDMPPGCRQVQGLRNARRVDCPFTRAPLASGPRIDHRKGPAMSETSTLLSLPYIQPAQAQKHVTHNEALRMLDALVQLAVESRALTEPPAAAVDGARYIVAAGATGDWAGQDQAVALNAGGGWLFLTPNVGWQAHVADEGIRVTWQGSVWQAATGGGALP